MDLKDIKAIIDLMKKNSIAEFELEKQDFKIRLKRGNIAGPVAYEDVPVLQQYAAPRTPSRWSSAKRCSRFAPFKAQPKCSVASFSRAADLLNTDY